MAFSRQKDPIRYMLDYLATQKATHTEELAIGRWDGEPAARELVGRINAIRDIQDEMKQFLGPHSSYIEQDLTQ